jgi:hypothetical protein
VPTSSGCHSVGSSAFTSQSGTRTPVRTLLASGVPLGSQDPADAPAPLAHASLYQG